jgi:C4-type Zn-finger protein
MRDPLEHITELEGQVARLEHALRRERALSAQWKRKARHTHARQELLDALNTVTAMLTDTEGEPHDR